MTSRKIKHQRALEKREEFFSTVKQGNLDVLRKVRDQRADEEKRQKEALKKAKIEKSKQLAKQNKQKNGVEINAEYAEERRRSNKTAVAKMAPKKENK